MEGEVHGLRCVALLDGRGGCEAEGQSESREEQHVDDFGWFTEWWFGGESKRCDGMSRKTSWNADHGLGFISDVLYVCSLADHNDTHGAPLPHSHPAEYGGPVVEVQLSNG
jgi:hypothetical protein